MKFAKIQFENRATAAKALVGIGKQSRIVGLRGGAYIVPEPALGWLRENSYNYELLDWLNQDDLVQTLRNNLAHPV
jgi:hypothetical protein